MHSVPACTRLSYVLRRQTSEFQVDSGMSPCNCTELGSVGPTGMASNQFEIREVASYLIQQLRWFVSNGMHPRIVDAGVEKNNHIKLFGSGIRGGEKPRVNTRHYTRGLH